MKNEFKKQDSKGNHIPSESEYREDYWDNFNNELLNKVKESKIGLVSFKTTPTKKKRLKEYAESLGFKSYAPVMRLLLDRLLDKDVETTKLDFIVQELSLKDEIISANERAVDIGVKNLEEHKSQLIDGGAKKDSPLVVSVDLIIKNLKNGKK